MFQNTSSLIADYLTDLFVLMLIQKGLKTNLKRINRERKVVGDKLPK